MCVAVNLPCQNYQFDNSSSTSDYAFSAPVAGDQYAYLSNVHSGCPGREAREQLRAPSTGPGWGDKRIGMPPLTSR